jgi:hypothetical protein
VQGEVIGRRLVLVLNIIAALIIVALGVREFVVPRVAVAVYGKQYKELVFKCDNVMREHLIAKNRMLSEPSDSAVRQLKAAEVGLIECQDYDMMRKRLISLGLTQNDLAILGLQAIEEREADVRAFVQIHQFKY